MQQVTVETKVQAEKQINSIAEGDGAGVDIYMGLGIQASATFDTKDAASHKEQRLGQMDAMRHLTT